MCIRDSATPLYTLRKLGKKFISLNVQKQEEAIAQITSLAKDIPAAQLALLYNTAVKKTGTRIAVAIVLAEHQKTAPALDAPAIDFIVKARKDKNPLLIKYAKIVKI